MSASDYETETLDRAPDLGIDPSDVDFDVELDEDLLPAAKRRWISTLGHDERFLWVKQADTGGGMPEQYDVLWLAQSPDLDLATATLLFWQILAQYPYAGSADDLNDTEHGVPQIRAALDTLMAGFARGAYPASGLGLSHADTAPMRKWLKNDINHMKKVTGWTESMAPFAIPAQVYDEIPGRAPVPPAVFPKPTSMADAHLMLMFTNLSLKTFTTAQPAGPRPKTVHPPLGFGENMIVLAAWAGAACFAAYVVYDLLFK